MPRLSNNERQNDLPNDMETDQVASRAASERDDRSRDEEGRFAGGRQTRSRDDDDDMTAGSGRGRGWFGDPQRHAQAGSHSHDNTRAGMRSRAYDEDDRSSGRHRTDDEEAEFGAWHAYGHNRGWHGYQRNAGGDLGPRSRDAEGRFTSGRGADYDDGRNYAGRSQDDYHGSRARDYDEDNDYRRAAPRGGNRPRDEEGRFTSHNRH